MVDAGFKLKELKRAHKDLELKGKGYRKRLEELQTAICKHLEQIQVDLVDHEKLQATLADEHLNAACDLKRACEMVTLLEAQLKEMNPNLDSIAEKQMVVTKIVAENEKFHEAANGKDNTSMLKFMSSSGFANGEGTIKAYVSNNLSLGDQQIAAQFQEIPLDLRMVEAERIGSAKFKD